MQVRMIYFIRQTMIFIKQSSAHTYKEYGFKHVIGGAGMKGLALCIWAERSYIDKRGQILIE
jgi:hypothetical protein